MSAKISIFPRMFRRAENNVPDGDLECRIQYEIYKLMNQLPTYAQQHRVLEHVTRIAYDRHIAQSTAVEQAAEQTALDAANGL